MDDQKMDNKTDVKSETKPKKKNKNKEKKRLLSLFRGPKAEHKLYRKLTDEESNHFRQTLNYIIKENPSLNKPTKGRKRVHNETETEQSDKKLTNDLQLGLNSIIRCIERKSVIGVVLTNPLALPLEDNIIELCSNNEIPCLSVQSLHELKSCLNISSLSAIAFKT